MKKSNDYNTDHLKDLSTRLGVIVISAATILASTEVAREVKTALSETVKHPTLAMEPIASEHQREAETVHSPISFGAAMRTPRTSGQ